MKTALIASAVAAVVMALVQPATACEPVRNAAASPHVAYAPEPPAATFERMLAPRRPIADAPLAPSAIDPLDAPFHAALWSGETVGAASLRTAKAR